MSDSDVSDEVESSETQLKMFGFGHEPNLSGKDVAAQAVAFIRVVFIYFFILFFYFIGNTALERDMWRQTQDKTQGM